jgi:hypothetical protein
MDKLRRTTAILLLSAVAVADAFAVIGPPFTTDDPQPVDFMHYEVYIASQYMDGRGGFTGSEPQVEFNYGAAPNLQVHFIAPFAYNDPILGPGQWGYGDTEFGLKYRFIQETKSTPMVGIFPLVEAPTGSVRRGLGNGAAQFFLPVWIQKTFGAWSSYGGGGYWRNPGTGNRDYWFFGLQAQRQVSKALAIGAELFHSTATTVDTTDRTGFNVGVVYDFDEGHHFLFSAGRSIGGEDVKTAYIAYQWTFGPKSKGE